METNSNPHISKDAGATTEAITLHNKCSEKTAENQRFARVADRYYQLITQPDGNKAWLARDKIELKADGVVLSNIPKYFGFTVEHNFRNYKSDINGWLNLSQALIWTPQKGDFPTIEKLFNHIFGEQVLLGYDRYTLLVRMPHQKQPILVVTSKEQSTGKSTLLNFDGWLLGCNAVNLNVSQYSQQFNALYAGKLAIGIDETVINETFIKERLKQDSTANTIQLRKMHTEHTTLPFFGKFTLCTNREDDFAKLEEEDMRFWVRKVGKIENFDPQFEANIKAEIPHFLYFLLNRELSVPEALSRQWFSREQLQTEALAKILENSKSSCAKDIELWVEEKLDQVSGFGITLTDLCEALGRKYALSVVREALKKELKMTPKHQRYTNYGGVSCVGRAYVFGNNMPSGYVPTQF